PPLFGSPCMSGVVLSISSTSPGRDFFHGFKSQFFDRASGDCRPCLCCAARRADQATRAHGTTSAGRRRKAAACGSSAQPGGRAATAGRCEACGSGAPGGKCKPAGHSAPLHVDRHSAATTRPDPEEVGAQEQQSNVVQVLVSALGL